MSRKTIYLIVSIVSFAKLFSQLDKGDKFYSNAQYAKAIPCYKKVAGSESSSKKDKAEALTKLGHSYKKINDYGKAESSYREALTVKSKVAPNTEFLYNYAQVLRVNHKYQEAAEQYNNYIRLNPNDVNVKNAMKFCQEIKFYLAKPIEYDVKSAGDINTANSEFAPFVAGDKMIFVAERDEFDFSEFRVNDFNGAPYPHIYSADIKEKEVAKPREFAGNINTEYYDGPVCLSQDGKTLYFSRVSYKKEQGLVNQAKIYSATLEGKNWTDIKVLNVSDDAYSVTHPCISPDNNTLYFTSNMPGGYGGKDIYMSRRSGITWTKPVNLGPDINTSGDEMYPSMRKDGTLYFCSSGLPGYGGLDIYSAQRIDNKWILNRNEGLNLNSSADDYGITFLTDSTGYFTSNREGGKGKDDIYRFTYTSKAASVSGKILLTKDLNNPARRLKITLRDDKGKNIDSTRTDEKGNFVFKNVNSDMNYMAVLDENDPAFAGKTRFYMAVKDSVIYRVSNRIGRDKFVLKNLSADPNGLPDMFVEDADLTLAGNLLYAENNASKPIKNARLKIVNEAGDVMEEVRTNELGAFVFRRIPNDQNYIISLEESDISLNAGTKVFLTNKNGKELRSFVVGKDKFNFKILKADKTLLQEMDVDDAELLMNVSGYMYDENKKAIANTKIQIREEGTNKVYDWTTNAAGRFNFRNLDADKNYLFETGENDPSLGGMRRIYIADANGKIFKVLDINGGKFNFKILDADKYAMGEFIVDDPWLQALDMKGSGKKDAAPLTIVESILYASGDFEPDEAGRKILDKVSSVLASNSRLMIEIISHTDSRSSDAFNLELSKKRAQTAVDYIAAKGIDKKRLKAIGYGETRLLNKCANGVPCTDEEHKVNRRTEFKMTEAPKM